MSVRWFSVLCISSIALVSCDCGKKAPPQSKAPDDPYAGLQIPGWKVVAETELTPQEAERLANGRDTVRELKEELMRAIMAAKNRGGVVAAIPACNSAAPTIHANVASKRGVRIGRTAKKLRNPSNLPPEWAAPIVELDVAKDVVLRADADGTLASMKPIILGDLCTKCHGSPEALAPGVPEQLAAYYPQDEATGFAKGDLRGWFWFEMPPKGAAEPPAAAPKQTEEPAGDSGTEVN